MPQKIRLPTLPMNGGCQCGAVRYQAHAYPATFYLCHCSECQKQSSSAFGESVRFAREDITVSGALGIYERKASSGMLRCEFCTQCGTRLFHYRASDYMNIKGGSFDDISWLVPAGHIWTSSKQPWIKIGADELQYAKQPPTYDALIARWAEMTRE